MNRRINTSYWRYAGVVSILISLLVGINTYYNEKAGIAELIQENLRLNHSLSIADLSGNMEALKEELTLIAESDNVINFANAKMGYQDVESDLYRDFDTWAQACVEHFEFYDLLMINPAGDVYYSVAKEDDLGTNLISGEYSNSSLGQVFREIKNAEKFTVADFTIYKPSNEELAAFIGMPIMFDGEFVGEITIQLPTSFEKLNIGVHIEDIQDYVITTNFIFQHLGSFNSLEANGFSIPRDASPLIRNDSLFLYTPFKLGDLDWGILSIAPPAVFANHLSWGNIIYHFILAILISLAISVLVIKSLYRRIRTLVYSASDVVLVKNTWRQFYRQKQAIGTDLYYRLKNKLGLKMDTGASDIEKVGLEIESLINNIITNLSEQEKLDDSLKELALAAHDIKFSTHKILQVPELFIESYEDELGSELPLRAKLAWKKILKSLALQIVKLKKEMKLKNID